MTTDRSRLAKALGSLALWAVLAVIPAGASAQATDPRMTLAFGAGQLQPLAKKIGFTAATWSVEFQAHATKHFLVGATLSGWQHTTIAFQDNVNTPLGQRTLTGSTGLTVRSIVFTAIATTMVKRMRFWSGAGVGYTAVTERPTLALACLPTDPQPCDTFSYAASSGSLAIEGLLGAGLRLTRRLEVFADYSLILPAMPGSAAVTLVGGLRVGIR